jgi:hypothetical protein
MSRCLIKPKADNQEITEVVVGLDRPLSSWYFQVFGGTKPNGEDNLILDEWCNQSRVVDLIDMYGDLQDLYTIQIRKAIASDRCPAELYGLKQISSWETADISSTYKDKESFVNWINDLVKEVKDEK